MQWWKLLPACIAFAPPWSWVGIIHQGKQKLRTGNQELETKNQELATVSCRKNSSQFLVASSQQGPSCAVQLATVASASISTSISGEISALIWIIAVAGRISPTN